MAVNMTITPGPDSIGPVGGIMSVYNNRSFLYTFTPTLAYDTFQASGTASSDFNTTTGVFSNTSGYSPVGSTKTLTVDSVRSYSPGTKTFFAGSTPGNTNGPVASAQFGGQCRGFAFDSFGNLFVSDTANNSIRKISGGVVSTFAGPTTYPGPSGYLDAAGTAARFDQPLAMTIDTSNNIYVIDRGNNVIRKITPLGVVTTLAGDGTSNIVDGALLSSSFAFGSFESITIDTSHPQPILYLDNVYYPSPTPTSYLRKIDLNTGIVSTLYEQYGGIIVGAAYDGNGNVYQNLADPNGFVYKTNVTTLERTIISGPGNFNFKLIFDSYGNLYSPSGTGTGFYKILANGDVVLYNLGTVDSLQLGVYNNIFYGGSDDSRIYTYTVQIDVAPTRARPTGYDIVATSGSLSTLVLSRLNILSETPPIVSGTTQLYKYEPFNYNYATILSGDSLVLTASPEVLSFTTSNSSNVTYSSVAGYQASYTNPLSFLLEVYSNSISRESRSFNVQVNAGRFFPPVNGTAYTLYQNEPITPIELDTSAEINQVTSAPSLPVGLSFSQVDPFGNVWYIQGAPTVRSTPSNYQLIGRNTTNGRVVTTNITLSVSGERVRLYVNDVPNFTSIPVSISGMIDGSAIANQIVTAQYPGSPAFSYQWSPNPPFGINYTNLSGNVVSQPFIPTDASQSIVLSGTPTVAALKSFAYTNTSNYTSTLRGIQVRPSGSISNSIPFVFSFGESVLFTADPYFKTVYVGVPLDSNDNISFEAQTYFGSNESIISIDSPDLRSDLSINFDFGNQKAYLVSALGASYVSTDTFTLRAVNTNSVTRDASLTIASIPDFVTWNSITPAVDTCYNFVYSRNLNNAKVGYYPSPIQFSATSAAGQVVTYSTPDFTGTGISLAGGTLAGIPLSVTSLQTAVITATAANTGATNTRQIKYAILDDVITISGAFPTQFYQNVPITPVQTTTTALSGRPVVLFTGTTLPSGITMSPGGLLSGTPTGLTASGTYSITAATVYKSATISLSYSLLSDKLVFFPDPESVYIPPGSNIPANVKYQGLAWSSTPVSNYYLDLTSNPTSFGIQITSTGSFYGTMTSNVPPAPIVPTEPIAVPFTVNASAGAATGTTQFTLSSTDANAYRVFSTIENSLTGNVLYYSLFTDLTYSPSSIYSNITAYNYTQWRPTSLTLPAGSWGTSIALAAPNFPSPDGVKMVVAANDSSTGYLYYSTDASNFLQATTPANSILTDLRYFVTARWYGAGTISGSSYFFYPTTASNWTTGLQSLLTDGVTQLIPRQGFQNAYEANGFLVESDPINTSRIFVGGGNGLMQSVNTGATWTRNTLLTGEVAGVFVLAQHLLVYGSEYYNTLNGVTAGTFVPSPTMRASYSGGPSIAIPGEFNSFCYALQTNFNVNLTLAAGIHFTGTGFIPQLRGSSSLYGPYAVVDLSTNPLFTESATPPKPPIGIGPIFFDGNYFYVFVNREATPGSYVQELYRHPNSFPFTNWTKSSVSFESLSNPKITSIGEISRRYFVQDSNCLLYLNLNPTNAGAPPIFTAPTQTSYIQYQYLAITPITVTAIPSSGPGPVYVFVRSSDLPRGLRFNQFTSTISGTPVVPGKQTLRLYAFDDSTGGFSTLVIEFNVLIPRIIRRQDGAGAYTSLLRNYVEVNSAQGARDATVFPEDNQRQGIFAAPEGPDVNSAPQVNPKCCNPNQ